MVRLERAQGAFSLIEIIAVLAVIAIIAAAALPALVQRIDYAAQGTEAANLGALAAGLTQASSRQRYIPSQDNWATFIATNIGWQVNAVSNNAVNNQRVFLIDPSLTTTMTLPYAQTIRGAGAIMPSARFIIMSSLSSRLPSGLSSGVLASSSDFNALWNNPDNTIPPAGTTWNWNTWTGHGTDIRIQRVNLTSSFNLLTLTVSDPVTASYSIDNFPLSTVTTGTTTNAYFLAGTVVNLYYPTSANPTNLQASQVLRQDVSWVFSSGLWRIAPVPVSSQSIGQTFYTNASNPISLMSPATIYNDMTNYMGLYVALGASGFNPAFKTNLQAASTVLSNHLGSVTNHL
jgi:prepilin-type N-terminal cleavage/methylation domain-containing protein